MPGVKVVIQRASIAQMVERKTLNLVVVGSIPTGGAFCTLLLGARHAAGPGGPWQASNKAALAQLGERQTEDLKVPGSIPGGGTFCQLQCPHGLMDKAHPS